MYRFTNKDNRRIGLPIQIIETGFLLDVGESRIVTNDHYKELMKSPKTVGRIATGSLIVTNLETKSNLDKGDS